jgi:hypothetical protein
MDQNASFVSLLADIDLADVATAVSPTINALSDEFVHAASRAWVLRRWILIGVVVAATTTVGLVVLRRRHSSGRPSGEQESRSAERAGAGAIPRRPPV